MNSKKNESFESKNTLLKSKECIKESENNSVWLSGFVKSVDEEYAHASRHHAENRALFEIRRLGFKEKKRELHFFFFFFFT